MPCLKAFFLEGARVKSDRPQRTLTQRKLINLLQGWTHLPMRCSEDFYTFLCLWKKRQEYPLVRSESIKD